MRRITPRAVKNGEDKKELKDWEEDVRKMFWEAGETDFAHDCLVGYLERVCDGKKVSTEFLYDILLPQD